MAKFHPNIRIGEVTDDHIDICYSHIFAGGQELVMAERLGGDSVLLKRIKRAITELEALSKREIDKYNKK